MTVLHVLQEIIDRKRRLVGVELDHHGSHAGPHFDLRIRRSIRRSNLTANEQCERCANDSEHGGESGGLTKRGSGRDLPLPVQLFNY
jgi:hypothetical protein